MARETELRCDKPQLCFFFFWGGGGGTCVIFDYLHLFDDLKH